MTHSRYWNVPVCQSSCVSVKAGDFPPCVWFSHISRWCQAGGFLDGQRCQRTARPLHFEDKILRRKKIAKCATCRETVFIRFFVFTQMEGVCLPLEDQPPPPLSLERKQDIWVAAPPVVWVWQWWWWWGVITCFTVCMWAFLCLAIAKPSVLLISVHATYTCFHSNLCMCVCVWEREMLRDVAPSALPHLNCSSKVIFQESFIYLHLQMCIYTCTVWEAHLTGLDLHRLVQKKDVSSTQMSQGSWWMFKSCFEF